MRVLQIQFHGECLIETKHEFHRSSLHLACFDDDTNPFLLNTHPEPKQANSEYASQLEVLMMIDTQM